MKDDRLYLIHISECIGRIESYTAGMTKDAFLSSTLVQDGVLRNLQVMAESTQRLSDHVKENHPTSTSIKSPAFAIFLCMITLVWMLSESGLY